MEAGSARAYCLHRSPRSTEVDTEEHPPPKLGAFAGPLTGSCLLSAAGPFPQQQAKHSVFCTPKLSTFTQSKPAEEQAPETDAK